MKNMMDMVSMMKKAQAVQTEMSAVQEKMEQTEFVGQAGDGAVKITLTGKYIPVSVKIAKDVVNSDDTETLEDLIVVALQNAEDQIGEASDKAFDEVKKKLNLPDNFELPF